MQSYSFKGGRNYRIWLAALVLFLLICSCSERHQLIKDLDIIRGSGSGSMDAQQLLLRLGKYALSHPEDEKMLYEYAIDLASDGYLSAALEISRSQLSKNSRNADFSTLFNKCNQLLNEPYRNYLYIYSASKDNKSEQIHQMIDSIYYLDSCIAIQAKKDAVEYAKRGNIYYDMNELQPANWDLSMALKIDSCNTQALYSMSFLQMKQRNNKIALKYVEKYQECALERAEKIAQNMPLFVKFISQLINIDSLVKNDNRNADLYFKRANLYVKAEVFNLAAEDASAAIKLDVNKGDYYALRAYIYHRSGLKAEALKDISKAESISGNRNTPLSKMIRESR